MALISVYDLLQNNRIINTFYVRNQFLNDWREYAKEHNITYTVSKPLEVEKFDILPDSAPFLGVYP
jgi:hypothetical protein